jgi:hypothetical protein
LTFDASKLPAYGDGGWFWLSQEGTEASRQIAEAQGAMADDIAAAYRAIFATPQGRIVLADLHFCTLAQPTWVPGVPDAAMAGCVREGQNSITRYILDKLNSGALEGAYTQPLFPTGATPNGTAQPEQPATGKPEGEAGDGNDDDAARRKRPNAIPAGDKRRARAKRSGELAGILDGTARPVEPEPAGRGEGGGRKRAKRRQGD